MNVIFFLQIYKWWSSLVDRIWTNRSI